MTQDTNPKAAVLRLLNEVLTAELTAINQYFLHAKMLQNWGFGKLYAKVRAESIDEMKHADILIERILYLDGLPNLQRLWPLRIGETVREQFVSDLALEDEAIPRLNEGIELGKRYSTEHSGSFVNGILDRVLRLRQQRDQSLVKDDPEAS